MDEIQLPDGRTLGYAEYGDVGGRAVFYFHGFPGSRLEAALLGPAAAARGVRIIAVERPGFGRSTFQPRRRLLDWPADVGRLADALGLARFSVLGLSGGGPYALACARALAHRLDEVDVVCGLGPARAWGTMTGMIWHNRWGLRAVRRAPWLARPVFALLAPAFRRSPEFFVTRLAARAAAPDRVFFGSPERRAVFAETFREAFRQGPRGPAREAVIFGGPWGFRLEEVAAEVRLWHGEADSVVPAEMGRRVAAALPHCRASFHAGEGHFSLVVNRVDEFLRAALS